MPISDRRRLLNIEPRSNARGLVKVYELGSTDSHLSVWYTLPPKLKKLSIECALSPDYLTLLRRGSEVMKPIKTKHMRGFETQGLSIALVAESGLKWEKPVQEWIGHGRTVRVGSKQRDFQMRLRAADSLAVEEAA